MNTFTRGIRNAFRNTIRTVSIVIILGLSIGLILSMLVARHAAQDRINTVKTSLGNVVTITPAGYSGFNEAGNPLTTTQLDPVAKLPHVTGVAENLNDRLVTNGSASLGAFTQNASTTNLTSPIDAGSLGQRAFRRFGGQVPSNFSLPITVLGTTDSSKLNNNTLTISSGSTFDGSKDAAVALISTDMASKNNLKVGSTFTAYNTTFTVNAIFDSGNRAGNDTVIMPLPTVQRLSSQSGAVTTAVASVDSVDNLDSATTAIKNALGSSTDVQNSAQQVQNAVQPLQNIMSISLYSLVGALIAGAVIIFLTMLMIVRERRREIGVLKAIGSSNGRIVLQFMSEAVTLTLLGAIVGLLGGLALSNPVLKLLASSASNTAQQAAASGGQGMMGGGRMFTRVLGGGINGRLQNLHAALSYHDMLYGLLAALLIAIVGSAIPAFLISKIRPAEVLRAE